MAVGFLRTFMRGLFITGTDTGVGKTLVTAAICRVLRQQGRRVSVCKPVATGARSVAGRRVCDDAVALGEAAGITPERVTRWMFSEPAAPPVAARLEGVALQLADLEAAVRAAGDNADILLVEGVGGLLCPLTERETVADLIAALHLPMVVVARRSLGTLNHTLLTVETAQNRGMAVAGVVISETVPPASVAEVSNVEELRARLSIPILGLVPYQCSGAIRVEDALRCVDWWALSETTHHSPLFH
jgi:dethiobiotin synthetase